jgi:thiamine-monophosphate kinase
MKDERLLIEQIVRALSAGTGARSRRLRLGIGDDAAVIRPTPEMDWAVSCDQFLEDVHFLANVHAPGSVGYKALARATSDLAAVGAAPRYFLLSLALPDERTSAWLRLFLSGMARAARQLGMILAGGDTSRFPKVAINLTVIGEVESHRAITRSGARSGDLIFVSGTLGGARLGLELVRAAHPARDARWQRFLKPHLYPQPRIGLGRWLAQRQLASAMIDISDGLSTDLGHICEASGVGARVWSSKIPVVRIPRALRREDLDSLALALHGGDDYELLFTVPAKQAHVLGTAFKGLRLTRIGEITKEKRLVLCEASGRERQLKPLGWDPFRTSAGARSRR